MQPLPDHDAAAEASELADLQASFPGFRIWRETLPGRRRYVARSQHLSVNPHTVITDDLDELRVVLSRPS